VFHKPGPLAEMYTQMMAKFTPPRRPQNDFERFMVDWWQLGAALMCPTDLNAMSKGLCQPAPWIDQVVDFDKLKKYPGDFYLSAYCIGDREHVTFDKEEITGEHFKASLAMPFIYSPYKMDGETYLEGAAQDALNYKGLIESIEKNEKKDQRKIENIIVFDVLGLDKTVGEPRNLYDAWVKSIIVPLVAIAQDDTTLFQRLHNVVRYPDGSLQRDEHGNPVENRKLLKVQFSEHMPEEQWPKVYDWSYSNLSTLFEVGRNAGKAFVKNNHAALFPEAETAA
jgi:predicted acylesterase/phospholipase RssA